MLPHRQAICPGNMLSVNQEIPKELVKADEAMLCPLLAGQMSVSLFCFNRAGFLFHIYVLDWNKSDFGFYFCRFMMDCSSMPVTPTHPRRGAAGLWSVTFPPAHIPQRCDINTNMFLLISCRLYSTLSDFTCIDLIVSVAFRILIVPGNFMQQCWHVEQTASITSPAMMHEDFQDFICTLYMNIYSWDQMWSVHF